MTSILRIFAVKPQETFRITLTASLIFFLIAANNLIKIVRDTVFLSHHAVTELPYLYILVAIVAGTIVALYSRFAGSVSLRRLIFATNWIILSNIVFFWILLTYLDSGWAHYAFYVWSAIAGAVAVAQAWTFTSEIFTAKEGKRLFGLVAAGGTLGGAAAAFGSAWTVERFIDTHHLLWFVAALFLMSSAVFSWADKQLGGRYGEEHIERAKKLQTESLGGLGPVLGGSRYLKALALLILLSVVVSTLIDFEFKAAAKQAHPSRYALAAFLSFYYGWLSIATFFVQTVLTGRILGRLGLFRSLYITPGVLFIGSLSILITPGLLAAALTRISDAALRNGIHRSSIEVLYMPLSTRAKKMVKTFLDVVVERAGDAAAGVVILIFTFVFSEGYVYVVHVVCMGLILGWMVLIPVLRIAHGYIQDAEGSSKSPSGEIVGRTQGSSDYLILDKTGSRPAHR